jgi:hypothetical protein
MTTSDNVAVRPRSSTPWNVCDTPGCRHNGCPPKVRAWGNYSRRFICAIPACAHDGCPAKLRARKDGQPFGEPYWGPALA